MFQPWIRTTGSRLYSRMTAEGIPGADKEKVFTRLWPGRRDFGLFFVKEVLALTGMTIAEKGCTRDGGEVRDRSGEGHVPGFPGRTLKPYFFPDPDEPANGNVFTYQETRVFSLHGDTFCEVPWFVVKVLQNARVALPRYEK